MTDNFLNMDFDTFVKEFANEPVNPSDEPKHVQETSTESVNGSSIEAQTEAFKVEVNRVENNSTPIDFSDISHISFDDLIQQASGVVDAGETLMTTSDSSNDKSPISFDDFVQGMNAAADPKPVVEIPSISPKEEVRPITESIEDISVPENPSSSKLEDVQDTPAKKPTLAFDLPAKKSAKKPTLAFEPSAKKPTLAFEPPADVPSKEVTSSVSDHSPLLDEETIQDIRQALRTVIRKEFKKCIKDVFEEFATLMD